MLLLALSRIENISQLEPKQRAGKQEVFTGMGVAETKPPDWSRTVPA